MAKRTAHMMALGVLVCFPLNAFPQTPQPAPRDDNQVWLGGQLAHPLRENTDLLLGTMLRLGRGGTEAYYERLEVGFDFRSGKYLTLSPIYSYVFNQPLGGAPNRENRIAFEATVALPVGRWVLSDRNVIERRFMDPKDTTRYKTRFQIERPISVVNRPLKVFAADEVVYDWAINAWARNRFYIGGEKNLNRRVSLETYYMRQNRKFTRPTNAHVLGFTLNTRF